MNDRLSLKQQAYEAIRGKLLQNQLVAGQIFNRRAIAEELGMSVAPVLEAMVQLENEGFLESIPRKGTQVRPVRREDVVGMSIVREALECQAARLYCGSKIKDATPELKPLALKLDQTGAGHPNHWEMELEFHTKLVALAGVPLLSDEFSRCIHLNMFFAINKLFPGETDKNRNSHEELLQILAECGPDEAETHLRKHVRSGKGPLSEVLEHNGAAI